MKKIFLLAVMLALQSPSAQAQSSSQPGYWHDQQGKPIAETESMRSQDGFAASIVASTDPDWKAKCETAPGTAPSFTTVKAIPLGQTVTFLIFFSNARRDAQGKSLVRCDLSLTDPKGSIAFSQKDVDCFAGKIAGPSHHMYLAAPTLAFSGDPGDPLGSWIMDAVLRDEVARITLPLRARVELKQ